MLYYILKHFYEHFYRSFKEKSNLKIIFNTMWQFNVTKNLLQYITFF